MKQLFLAGLAGGMILGCTEPTNIDRTPVGPKAEAYEVGAQEPSEPVPSEYNVPTSISVAAEAGFTEIASGNEAYGKSIVNFTATHGRANVRLEIAGYPDAFGEKQESSLFPTTKGVTAMTKRIIKETCGKSARAEASGIAWNEFVSLVNVLRWGEKRDSDNDTAMLDACPTQPAGGGGIDHCDWYQIEISYDMGETWEDYGMQWLCPGDEIQWEIRKGRKVNLARPSGVSATRTSERRPAQKKQASILFVGTHYLDVNAHAFVQSGARFGVDAVVLVDTMRASPDDLEAAILAAAYHVNTAPLGESQRIAVGKSGLRLTGPAKARATDRAKPILQATKQARSLLSVSGRTGRAFKTTVTLPSVRSAKDLP
jgi:hypothetical protein